MFSPQSIVYAWDNQLRYALALLEDVTPEKMFARPSGNVNHPSWIIGHVALYHPAIVALLKGEPVVDPKDHPLFGFTGKGAVDDPSLYEAKGPLLDRFATGHEAVAQALLNATPDDFQRPPSLERWAVEYPTVEFMLPDLAIFHETMHLGQISFWRRAAGLPAIPFPDRTPRVGILN